MFLRRKDGLFEVKGGRSDKASEVLNDNEMPKLRNQKFRGDPDDEPWLPSGFLEAKGHWAQTPSYLSLSPESDARLLGVFLILKTN